MCHTECLKFHDIIIESCDEPKMYLTVVTVTVLFRQKIEGK